MIPPPVQPKIYHITHIDNLPSIVTTGYIESDRRRLEQGSGQTSIGMTEIKRRRLQKIEVSCHPNTKVGAYVPFYFCFRSMMLYILYRGNHPDLSHYRDGQEPVLHLQVDMKAAIELADQHGVRWAFSDRNAGTFYTSFYNSYNQLGKIDWAAVKATDFSDAQVKEGKQAEFLIHDTCPWHLIEKIGVHNKKRLDQVNTLIKYIAHKPIVAVERAWYF